MKTSKKEPKPYLDLPLKKEWYEMIKSGGKREEYREIKPFWEKRLFKGYTKVRFRYGYTNRCMMFTIFGISKGIGRPEWGAPDHEVYIISFGMKEDYE